VDEREIKKPALRRLFYLHEENEFLLNLAADHVRIYRFAAEISGHVIAAQV
jgi:hypothetical protein